MYWYLEALKKYAVFSGRARRKEYWSFILFNMIAAIFLSIIDVFSGTWNPQVSLGLISGLYILFALMPGLAVTSRRLHDTNRSAWWIVFSLIPIIGPIIVFIFLVQNGQKSDNRYGSNPKAAFA